MNGRLALRILSMACFAMFVSAGFTPAVCELQDHGPDGEFFHDTATDLYWLDPQLLAPNTRETMDRIVVHSDIWSWARSAQIDALLGQSSTGGVNLDTVIGERFDTLMEGGPRWLGFYEGTDPDGWLVDVDDPPEHDTVTTTGYQYNAAGINPGGWLVSGVDPVVAGRVLEDAGSAGVWFLDHATGFYWHDPSTFAGMERTAIDDWLTAHPGCRWATADEVFGLLGKATKDDSSLETVMGAPSQHLSNGHRWSGFFDATAEPSAINLHTIVAPSYRMILTGGYQYVMGTVHSGAWIVSETDPTPTETSSLGEVKRSFR